MFVALGDSPPSPIPAHLARKGVKRPGTNTQGSTSVSGPDRVSEDRLKPCQHCSRKFAPSRIDTHEGICGRLKNRGARPEFDVAERRAQAVREQANRKVNFIDDSWRDQQPQRSRSQPTARRLNMENWDTSTRTSSNGQMDVDDMPAGVNTRRDYQPRNGPATQHDVQPQPRSPRRHAHVESEKYNPRNDNTNLVEPEYYQPRAAPSYDPQSGRGHHHRRHHGDDQVLPNAQSEFPTITIQPTNSGLVIALDKTDDELQASPRKAHYTKNQVRSPRHSSSRDRPVEQQYRTPMPVPIVEHQDRVNVIRDRGSNHSRHNSGHHHALDDAASSISYSSYQSEKQREMEKEHRARHQYEVGQWENSKRRERERMEEDIARQKYEQDKLKLRNRHHEYEDQEPRSRTRSHSHGGVSHRRREEPVRSHSSDRVYQSQYDELGSPVSRREEKEFLRQDRLKDWQEHTPVRSQGGSSQHRSHSEPRLSTRSDRGYADSGEIQMVRTPSPIRKIGNRRTATTVTNPNAGRPKSPRHPLSSAVPLPPYNSIEDVPPDVLDRIDLEDSPSPPRHSNEPVSPPNPYFTNPTRGRSQSHGANTTSTRVDSYAQPHVQQYSQPEMVVTAPSLSDVSSISSSSYKRRSHSHSAASSRKREQAKRLYEGSLHDTREREQAKHRDREEPRKQPPSDAALDAEFSRKNKHVDIHARQYTSYGDPGVPLARRRAQSVGASPSPARTNRYTDELRYYDSPTKSPAKKTQFAEPLQAATPSKRTSPSPTRSRRSSSPALSLNSHELTPVGKGGLAWWEASEANKIDEDGNITSWTPPGRGARIPTHSRESSVPGPRSPTPSRPPPFSPASSGHSSSSSRYNKRPSSPSRRPSGRVSPSRSSLSHSPKRNSPKRNSSSLYYDEPYETGNHRYGNQEWNNLDSTSSDGDEVRRSLLFENPPLTGPIYTHRPSPPPPIPVSSSLGTSFGATGTGSHGLTSSGPYSPLSSSLSEPPLLLHDAVPLDSSGSSFEVDWNTRHKVKNHRSYVTGSPGKRPPIHLDSTGGLGGNFQHGTVMGSPRKGSPPREVTWGPVVEDNYAYAPPPRVRVLTGSPRVVAENHYFVPHSPRIHTEVL
eukprot:TRINITY_DN47448_c0_g1_i1.p1 TRINITY_DN47448_c0_g1~~TRINITY_DN47448_c0_g1_i1.p1  ORF type:complete len:1111 (-),score=42.53 TRINITY_DN47448_c0_g1_i1:116-3448(-)